MSDNCTRMSDNRIDFQVEMTDVSIMVASHVSSGTEFIMSDISSGIEWQVQMTVVSLIDSCSYIECHV